MELAGREMVLVTAKLPIVLVTPPPKVLALVKMLALLRYANVEEPVKLLMDKPVTVAPVKLAEEVTVRAPILPVLMVALFWVVVPNVLVPVNV